MASFIGEITAWVQGIITMLFGGTVGTGSTAVEVEGVFGAILAQPVLVALLVGVPLVTLLVGLVTRLIKRSARRG